MLITVSKKGNVTVDEMILGYVGETNSRTIRINHPEAENAKYSFRIEYSDGVIYDIPIENNADTLSASVLRIAGKVECQFISTISSGDVYTIVFKSKCFYMLIGESISSDVAPIPSYEEAVSLLDSLLNGIIQCKLTQADYDNMISHNENTLYFATSENNIKMYLGEIELVSGEKNISEALGINDSIVGNGIVGVAQPVPSTINESEEM